MALQGLRLSPNRHKTKANQPPHVCNFGFMAARQPSEPQTATKPKPINHPMTAALDLWCFGAPHNL